jgi:tripartite-type tricarboxylate transporter receptor subunit TctC
MPFTRTMLKYFLGCMLVCVAGLAGGQAFPERQVRMVTSAAGGSSDFAARFVAQGMTVGLGQPVVVDSRGGGVAAIEIVQKASPDGYTLLYYGSILWLLPLMQEAPYDTLRDFIPVSLSVSSPNIVLVHPSLPAKTIKELIALAKARPGQLNYGSGGTGSSGHMAAELFKYMAGVDIVRVPFKGTGPAQNSLMAGEIQVLIPSAGGLAPAIQSGRVRALAVTGSRRMATYPDLPTVAESGVRGYEYGQYSGVFAPVKTPSAVIERLNREAVRAVKDPDTREKLLKVGVEPEGSTPQAFVTLIKEEVARLGTVIRKANIRM